jgi:hypothetical protein
MLFVVSDDALALLASSPLLPHVSIAFGRLLSSYSDGHHIVIMNPQGCKKIENCAAFSDEDRAAAKRIRNRYSEYGALPEKICLYARVTNEGMSPTRTIQGWDVPLTWLAKNPLLPSQLLGEDLNDANIFEYCGQDYLEVSGLRSFAIRASLTQGGGGNTHRVLEQIAIVEQKICLCIVDSDKKSPTAPPGTTALPCLSVFGSGLFSVTLTAGKTIENSIPWRLIDKTRTANTVLPSLELTSLEQKHANACWFINLKRGINGHDVNCLTSPTCRSYWSNCATAVAGVPTCCDAMACKEKNHGDCKYKVHKGYGNSLLGDVATWLKSNQTTSRSKQYLPSPNDADWLRIGKEVAAFAFGQQPRRI